MARCCGDRPGNPAGQARPNPGQREARMANDSDFVRIKYLHQNRGSHRVIGPAVLSDRMAGVPMVKVRNGWSLDYGYRSSGDQFLVHRADMDAAPHLFKSLEEGASGVVNLPKRKAPTPPPPTRVAGGKARLGMRDVLPAGAQEPVARREPTPEELLKARKERVFDPQLVPGITDAVARQMTEDGIASEADILALGERGLQKYKGIGPEKARVIIEALRAKEEAP
jgi:hypothetical protein